MNIPITDDADSMEQRASSNTGYIASDVDVLINLQILKKTRKGIEPNPNLSTQPDEIRDFLTWATGSKKNPLPPLARRLLCLKRALIKNSIASAGPSTLQRTGEKSQLEEIDALLRADGATNLDDSMKCATEGSKWVPYSKGAGKPQVSSTPGGPGCTTTVNCAGDSVLTKMLADIQTKLNEIAGLQPLSPKIDEIATLLRDLLTVVGRPSDDDNLSQQMRRMKTTLDELKTGRISAPVDDASSVVSGASGASGASNISIITTRLQGLETKINKLLPPGPNPNPNPDPLIVARAEIAPPGGNVPGNIKPPPVIPTPTIPPAQIQEERDDIIEEIRLIQARIMSLPIAEINRELTTLKEYVQRIPNISGTAFTTLFDAIKEKIQESETRIQRRIQNIEASLARLNETVQLVRLNLDRNPENINDYIELQGAAIEGQIQGIKEDIIDTLRAQHQETQTTIKDCCDKSQQRNVATHTKLNAIDAKLDALTRTVDEGDSAHHVLLEQMSRLEGLIKAIRCPENEPILTALQTYTDELRRRIDTLKANNADGRNVARIQQITALEQRIRELQTQVEDCTGSRARVAELENNIGALETELARLRREGEGKNGRIHELTTAAAERDRNIREKEAAIEQLREELHVATGHALGIFEDLEEAERTIERLKEEQRLLNESIRNKDIRIRELGNLADRRQEELEVAIREKEEHQVRATELQTRIERLEKQIEDERAESAITIAELRSQLEALRLEKAASDARADAAEAQVEDLRRQLTTGADERTATIARLTDEKADFERQLRECNEALEILRASKTEVERLRDTETQERTEVIERLQTEIREINTKMNTRVKEYEERLRETTRKCAEQMDALSRQHKANMNKESNKCRNAMNNASREAMEQLEEEKDKLIEQLKALAKSSKVLGEENSQLKAQLDDLRKVNDDLAEARRAHADCEKQLKEANDALARSEEEKGAAQRDVSAARTRISELDAMTRTAQDGKARMEEERDKARKAASDCDEEKHAAAADCEKLREYKEKANENLRRAIKENVASELKRSAEHAKRVETIPKALVMPDLAKADHKDLMPILVPALNKIISYSNRGAKNVGIPDVSGLILRLLGAYRTHSDQTMSRDLDRFLNSTSTGRTIRDKAGIKAGTSPMKQFEQVMGFLYNLPKDIATYRTSGGRRTVKRYGKEKVSRYTRKG